MTMVAIDNERLKTIRKARKIGRPKLAKLIGLPERQITKAETTPGTLLPQDVVVRLSGALQVPSETLTGALDMCENDLTPASQLARSCSCCN